MPRKQKSSGPAAPVPLAGPQRLNKLLAAAGLGSRREVEQYIIEGRVEVDGQAVTDLATKVDPETAKLTFDGSAIKIFRPVYFALNKPVGVLSTNRDPSGRMRAIDLINVKERIFSAGRLDRSSEGLMLLTNDGELAQRLSHPRYGIQKVYLATVQGEITQADLDKLTRGVRLAEGYAKVDAVKVRKQRSGAADLEIALSEGKNREIRRILARLGHKVVGLKRLAIGPLKLGPLPAGGWRPLTKQEIQALYDAAITGRRKKRGTGKPLRGKPRSTEDAVPGKELSAGQFDRYNQDDYEEDFGPSLDELSDDELGGYDDLMVVGNEEIRGTVLPYDEDAVEEEFIDDADEPLFADHDDEDDDDDEFGASDEQDEAPARRGRPPRDSGERFRSTRSPNDLRNRNRSTSGDGRGERSGPRGVKAARGSRSAQGPRSASSGPRSGAKKAGPGRVGSGRSGTSRPGASRPGASRPGMGRVGGVRAGGRPSSGRPSSRPSSDGPRQNYSRSDDGGDGRGGEGRSAARSGERPASRPAGRSGPGKTGYGRGAPRSGSSGPRSGNSGPGRGSSGRGSSGPSSSGPRSGPGQSGPSRGGPGRSGPGKSGPTRGGPGRSGPGRSGPGRSGGSGPGRSGPGRSGPGRSGPGRGGPRGKGGNR